MASVCIEDGDETWFPVGTVALEETGTTDIQLLDCTIETSLLSLGAVPNIRNLNFEATKAKFRKIFPWEKNIEIKRAGSIVDLLYLSKFSISKSESKGDNRIGFNTDIDILFIPTTTHVANNESDDQNAVAIIEPTEYASFVKLKYNERCQYKVPVSILTLDENTNDRYISSQKFLQIMEGYMNIKKTVAEIAGPSIQLLSSAIHGPQYFLTSADIVFAFKNPEWPLSSSEWLTRERPNDWPPAEVIHEIQHLGSHVVAKGNSVDPDTDIVWRLSFNLAERKIAELMTAKQRKCFLIAKAMIKETQLETISSYHAKTVLWWMLERDDMDMWSKEGVGHCFLAYLGHLIEALKMHTIKNYFMPKNNMIEHVSEDAVHKLTVRLEKIHRKPLSAILNSRSLTENSKEIFSLCPEEKYDFNHLKDAMLLYGGEKKAKDQLLHIFNVHFYNLGICFVVDPNQREKGITLLKKVAELLNPEADAIGFVTHELIGAMNSSFKNKREKEGLHFLAALLTVISTEEATQLLAEGGNTNAVLATLFHNTGGVLFMWSRRGFWKEQREEDIKSCEKCLQTSVSLNPDVPQHHAEYAHFLLVEERHAEALHHAENAINILGNFACLSYSMEDIDNVDNSIGRHVQCENGIIIPAIIIAYHVVVQAKKHLNEVDDFDQILANYLDACQDDANSMRYESLSVYGYSCMSLGRYKKAKEAFVQASEMKCSDLQDENLDICNTCIVSDLTN